MNPIYCGNNANNPDLVNGHRVLGTRYSCLQKGKSNGYVQPVDPNFLLPYQPIDPTRKYCGNSAALPAGYDRFGGLYECYLKGMGVGKRLKAQAGIPDGNDSSSPPPSPPDNSPDNSSDGKYNDSSSPPPSPPDNSSDRKYNDFDLVLDIENDPRVDTSSDGKFESKDSEKESLDDRYLSSFENRKEQNEDKSNWNKYVIGVIVYLMGLTIFFLGMYYGKPGIILDKTYLNEERIDWSKFTPYLVSFAVIYALIIYFFINYLFR